MVFLLIMVATGWVVVQSTWLKRKLDGIFKRVHFSREREREIQEERNSRERSIQEGEEKCVLGIYPLLLDTTQSINQHVMFSHIARILHSLAKYPFECDFYNQNMIHLTENHFEEMFKAIIMTLIHTKHDINP